MIIWEKEYIITKAKCKTSDQMNKAVTCILQKWGRHMGSVTIFLRLL